ncbi:NAD(P)-dependent alcohol dehydrogenase [Pseudonocardia hispaniensis]|uniref:NAD(P)-dependent alcohol dehydrogenase n=1 Tax=Pseudonocardia hispaniensis TaxID=904933 RepID=A0ABW1IWZ9_9PSEU
MHMRAAVLREHGGPFKMEDLELAEPGMGELLVEVAGVGFCHTDVMPRAEAFMAEPPLILGHEGSGVVVAAGPCTTITVGTPVVMSFDHCGRCANCLDGHPAYCRSFWGRNMVGRSRSSSPVTDVAGRSIGARWFGQSSFATHALTREDAVVPVPSDLPLELLGPLACSVLTGAGAVFNTLAVSAGDSIAVYGAGAVGLSAVMAAAATGATQVIAIDRHKERLELALELGATEVIDTQCLSQELGQEVVARSAGGTRTALDTTGVAPVIASAVTGLRTRGILGMVSMASSDIVLQRDALATGKTITGILEGDSVPRIHIPRLITLWRGGHLPFERLIQTYPMNDINQAEADMASGRTIKPVLIPHSR